MCNGNRLRVAQILGIGRTSLYRHLKRDGGRVFFCSFLTTVLCFTNKLNPESPKLFPDSSSPHNAFSL